MRSDRLHRSNHNGDYKDLCLALYRASLLPILQTSHSLPAYNHSPHLCREILLSILSPSIFISFQGLIADLFNFTPGSLMTVKSPGPHALCERKLFIAAPSVAFEYWAKGGKFAGRIFLADWAGFEFRGCANREFNNYDAAIFFAFVFVVSHFFLSMPLLGFSVGILRNVLLILLR